MIYKYFTLIILFVFIIYCNNDVDKEINSKNLKIIKQSNFEKVLYDYMLMDNYIHKNISNDSITIDSINYIKESIFNKYNISQEVFNHNKKYYINNGNFDEICNNVISQLDIERKKYEQK